MSPPHVRCVLSPLIFFFNDTATTEIYTLSLHDALPISNYSFGLWLSASRGRAGGSIRMADRKSTRLNSSHANISYAVFCLKKNKQELDINLKHNLKIKSKTILITQQQS